MKNATEQTWKGRRSRETGKGQGVQGIPILLFHFYSPLLTPLRFYPTAALNSFHPYHQTFKHPKRTLRGMFWVRCSPPPTTPPENMCRGLYVPLPSEQGLDLPVFQKTAPIWAKMRGRIPPSFVVWGGVHPTHRPIQALACPLDEWGGFSPSFVPSFCLGWRASHTPSHPPTCTNQGTKPTNEGGNSPSFPPHLAYCRALPDFDSGAQSPHLEGNGVPRNP